VIRHSKYNAAYAINTNFGYNSHLEAETAITKNYEKRPRILVSVAIKIEVREHVVAKYRIKT